MPFIQLIEVSTNRLDEIEQVIDRWLRDTEGRRTTRRATFASDNDLPGHYVHIVEFDSYEDAIANSALTETSAFAKRLAALCDRPPTFRNLNVERMAV